jgi:hypothetical protein
MMRVTPTESQELLVASIMTRCLEEGQTFDLKKLALSDFNYLMVQVSRMTYGTSHKYGVQCPFCQKFEEYIDLSKLEVKDLEKEQYDKYIEDNIPAKNDMRDRSGAKVKIRVLNIEQIDELRQVAKNDPERLNTATLVAIIDMVDEKKLDPIQREKYVMELSPAGKRVLLSRHDKVSDFGIVLQQTHVCSNCQKTATYPFLVEGNVELFTPTVD